MLDSEKNENEKRNLFQSAYDRLFSANIFFLYIIVKHGKYYRPVLVDHHLCTGIHIT